jgi:hypothetical protein
MHFGSQLLHKFGVEVENVPSGHVEWQVLFQRYAILAPLKVQDEQVVDELEHVIHLGSQLLHILGLMVK